MSTAKTLDQRRSQPTTRRTARRIGVDQGADFEQRRLIILREAARAFNENGVRNTSLDDVAARLGVTKPALYHYVSSKEEMIRQCLALAMEDNRELLAKANASGGSGLNKLRFIFSHWPHNSIADFGRYMVLLDMNELSPESQTRHREMQRLVLRGIEAIIQEGIQDGSVRPSDPAVVTLSLIGLFNSPARWYRVDGRLTIDEITSELLALLESGVAA